MIRDRRGIILIGLPRGVYVARAPAVSTHTATYTIANNHRTLVVVFGSTLGLLAPVVPGRTFGSIVVRSLVMIPFRDFVLVREPRDM